MQCRRRGVVEPVTNYRDPALLKEPSSCVLDKIIENVKLCNIFKLK